MPAWATQAVSDQRGFLQATMKRQNEAAAGTLRTAFGHEDGACGCHRHVRRRAEFGLIKRLKSSGKFAVIARFERAEEHRQPGAAESAATQLSVGRLPTVFRRERVNGADRLCERRGELGDEARKRCLFSLRPG
jgi:hypothetical protein